MGCILLPFLCVLLSIFTEDAADQFAGFFVSLLADVPVVKYCTDAITIFLSGSGSTEQQLEFISALGSLTPWTAMSAASVGMLSGICFKLGELIGLRGLPVMQAMLAVVLSGMLSSVFTLYGDGLYISLSFVFCLTANLVLTILTAKKKFSAVLWGIGSEIVVGVFAAAYAALLILLMQGAISSLGIWLGLHLCLTIPMLLFLAVDLLSFK